MLVSSDAGNLAWLRFALDDFTSMLKWAAAILALFVALFAMLSMAYDQSYRRRSLILGMNALRVAHTDYQKHGNITDGYGQEFRVVLSTNVVVADGTRYQCFAEVTGGGGWEGGTLAMTTNQIFIWLNAGKPPKILPLGHRPPLFGGPY